MDLTLTPVELAFQQQVREFLDAELKPEWRGVSDIDNRTQPEIMAQWQAVLARKRLADRGMAARQWRAGLVAHAAPYFQGSVQQGPRAKDFDDVDRDDRAVNLRVRQSGAAGVYLPRIISGADIWCQGFSEPGAGSDLASLKTSARREGDDYVVSGQKIWTTYAHVATQMFCLVRTDPRAARPQAGISMLLIDMELPGITVRPIHTIDGEHHFNECFSMMFASR